MALCGAGKASKRGWGVKFANLITNSCLVRTAQVFVRHLRCGSAFCFRGDGVLEPLKSVKLKSET